MREGKEVADYRNYLPQMHRYWFSSNETRNAFWDLDMDLDSNLTIRF